MKTDALGQLTRAFFCVKGENFEENNRLGTF